MREDYGSFELEAGSDEFGIAFAMVSKALVTAGFVG